MCESNGPWRITFDTNPDDCNLHCIMCEEHSPYRKKVATHDHRVMDIEVIRQTVAQMTPKGLREIIPSTMGEPLLYKHFDEIIEIAQEHGVLINLTTNGTWPGKGVEEWARKLCPLCSDIKVSWNGAKAETQEAIMQGLSFSKRLKALKSFLKIRAEITDSGLNRCRMTLQCTFMETNLEELPDLVHLAAELGMERVKGHHIWVHYPETSCLDLRRSADSRTRWNKTVELCEEAAEMHRLPNGKKILLENFVPLPENEEISLPEQWKCPFLKQEAWVNHAGRFDPCCAPDPERQKLGEFGFVASEGGLEALWNSTAYLKLVREYREHPVCKKCNMRRPEEKAA
ncbi:MAG: radical SAM protein [Methanosarcina sp.]|nr:MAG: radical SAM protein [Methanosarcina sp.]